MYGKPITIPLNAEAVCVLREPQGLHDHGVVNFRWRDLRLTWANWRIQTGRPLPALKELGGWAGLEMVLRYAYPGADPLAHHAERISRPRVIRTESGAAQEKIFNSLN